MKKSESSETCDDWVSGHLYHHENLERVVLGFVHPLVTALSAESEITGFFFIRYGLGGPHVRLRLRPTEEARDSCLDRMEQYAHAFLAREPSTCWFDENVIQLGNSATLTNDPHEIDASVYPDNSFHVLPLRPEVERYGGASRIGFSLDYFTLSSVAVLEQLSTLGQVSRSVRLARAFELLLRQALGFAADEIELTSLLRYGVEWFGNNLRKVLEKGTSVARSNRSHFLQLSQDSFEETCRLLMRDETFELSPRNLLVVGARRLSMAVDGADRSTRLRIGASQLHMTASRLGLSNPEEAYLSQILSLIVDELRATTPIDGVLTSSEADSASSLRELLPVAMAALAEASENVSFR